MTAPQMWECFQQQTGVHAQYDAWAFGSDSDALAMLVLEGAKTATSSAYPLYALDSEPLPENGAYSVILNAAGNAVCVIQTTRVYLSPFRDIRPEHAFREGEGDRSLAYWQAIHRAFFTEALAQAGIVFHEDTMIVCEEFRVVYPKAQCAKETP